MSQLPHEDGDQPSQHAAATLIPTSNQGLFYLAPGLPAPSRPTWMPSATERLNVGSISGPSTLPAGPIVLGKSAAPAEPVVNATLFTGSTTSTEMASVATIGGELPPNHSHSGAPGTSAQAQDQTAPKTTIFVSLAVTKLQQGRSQAAEMRKKYRDAMDAARPGNTSFSQLAFMYSGALRKYVCRKSVTCASCHIKISPILMSSEDMPYYEQVHINVLSYVYKHVKVIVSRDRKLIFFHIAVPL